MGFALATTWLAVATPGGNGLAFQGPRPRSSLDKTRCVMDQIGSTAKTHVLDVQYCVQELTPVDPSLDLLAAAAIALVINKYVNVLS
jgi:hypothetical protein